jgi:hypothetical protein
MLPVLLKHGFPMIWVLLFLSAVVIYVFIERASIITAPKSTPLNSSTGFETS